MRPKPDRSSAANSIATTSQCGPPAAGTRMSGAGKRKQPIRNAGPTPIRREMRAVTTEPKSVPIDATPSTTPSVPGRTWSERVA